MVRNKRVFHLISHPVCSTENLRVAECVNDKGAVNPDDNKPSRRSDEDPAPSICYHEVSRQAER